MKIGRFMLSMLATAAVMLFATSFAQAQNNRSWVSSTGDDNAACTRAAPCRTFQGALAKTNQQGEIDAIDAAEYGNNASNVGAISSTSTLTIGKSAGAFVAGDYHVWIHNFVGSTFAGSSAVVTVLRMDPQGVSTQLTRQEVQFATGDQADDLWHVVNLNVGAGGSAGSGMMDAFRRCGGSGFLDSEIS